MSIRSLRNILVGELARLRRSILSYSLEKVGGRRGDGIGDGIWDVGANAVDHRPFPEDVKPTETDTPPEASAPKS